MMEKQAENVQNWREILIENTLDAVVGINSKSEIIDWNSQAESIFGWTRNEVLTKKLPDVVIPPEFRSRHYQGIQLYLQTGIGPILNKRVELEAIKSSGERFPVELTVFPIQTDGNIFFYSFVRDITEKKTKEDDQRLLSELSALVSRISDEDILIAKITELLAGRLRASRCWIAEANEENTSAIVTQDYSEGLPSLIGTYDLNIFGTEMVEAWKNGKTVAVNDVKTDARTYQNAESHLKLKIRSFISVPLHRAGKRLALLDISSEIPRNWSEREKNIARTAAEMVWSVIENNRLLVALKQAISARDEFISICSHELKTPVTSMKLQFQMAARQIQRKDQRVYSKESMERRILSANTQLDRMAKLIEDMLDVSKISSGKLKMEMQAVDLKLLASESIQRFHEQFENMEIPVEFKSSDSSTYVLGDKYRLEQVISNLITNAIKYGEGNKITFTVNSSPTLVTLSVQDKGMGIAKENLDKIFQRYERAVPSSSISGLGLGLFISMQITEAHNGKLRVESQLGEGSTFILELPRFSIK